MKEKIKIYFQKSLSYFVVIFCFLFFPVFFIVSTVHIFCWNNTENLKQSKITEMDYALEYLNKYSNNKKYFHYLLTKYSEYAQISDNPLESLKKNINNLKAKYPNKFQFIVWDSNGKVVKELSDKTGFNYVISKLYEVLNDVTNSVRIDPTLRISEIKSVKKNINLLHSFFGRIFIAENLKYPIYSGIDSGPLKTDVGNSFCHVWFKVDKKVSFLCFISDELITDYSGLDKISKVLSKNSDIIFGYSKIPNYEMPVSVFPERYKADLAMALITYDKGGDNLFENSRVLVKMSMPQPSIRTFCFLPKHDETWDYNYKRNILSGILFSILLGIYCLFGYWFLFKHHFFSIKWKLTVLFMLANLVPISILGLVTKIYVENKKISLTSEITDNLEKTIREFDLQYNYLFEDYNLKLNSIVDKISENIGISEIKEPEIKKLYSLYDELDLTYLYLVASSGEVITYKYDEKKSKITTDFISTVGINVISFLNDKEIEIAKDDVFSNIYDREKSDFLLSFLKNNGTVHEVLIGEEFRTFYSYVFGDKRNYNNNYLFIIIWDKEDFLNIYLKKYYNNIYKTVPDGDFFIKSNNSNNTYGSVELKKYLEPVFEKISGVSEKITGHIDIKGNNHIFVCLSGLNLKNWTLVATYPEDMINKEINILIIQIVVGALLSLLFSLIIVQMLFLNFLKPIRNLGEATLAIGERNFSHRVPIGDKDEFGYLNQVFNRVIEGLGDFEVAKIVQESLFPGNSFKTGSFDIFGRSVVMTTLGGDYYDCFKINDDYQGVIIGDVAGHGIPAGLMMAMAKASVLSAPDEIKLDPTALTTRLHKMFYAIKNEKLKRMMTFMYFVFNVNNGHFIYTNAGHCYPIIVDSVKKTASFLEYIATPLGIGPRCRCKNQELELAVGQSLILYTDGIVEANNSEGEQYGYDRFIDCLPLNYDVSAEKFYYNLYEDVYKKWSPKQEDDLTLILINRN